MNWLKENIAPVIAIVTVIGGFLYLFYGPQEDRAAVIALMMLAPTYYFGSSPGSRSKDEALIKISEKEKAS